MPLFLGGGAGRLVALRFVVGRGAFTAVILLSLGGFCKAMSDVLKQSVGGGGYL